LSRSFFAFNRHGGEVVLQAFVDEAVATADALKEEEIGAVVEEAGIVPGDLAGGPDFRA